jgi:Domain of unknown function (DUF4282)
MQFIKTIFDLSFSRFVIVPIVRALYCFALIVAAVQFIGMIVGGVIGIITAEHQMNLWLALGSSAPPIGPREIETNKIVSIATLVAAPFAAIGTIVWARVAAELTVVIFSIAESLKSGAPAAR